tara:strand:+ start:299 stop:1018 length:720 start_codon:yes stop_codon:yes gene_type:complete
MQLDTLLIVIVISAIQSIFGVGVLLFGTPLLLLLGYNFHYTLYILLPISIAINSLQILKHFHYIDLLFYKNVLLSTIPFVVTFLIIGLTAKINISLFVGLFLVFIALKDFSEKFSLILKFTSRHQRIYLVIMGIVHGLTNLGGSLLTAIVHEKQYPKNKTRSTIAVCYMTFAIFQIITLSFLVSEFDVSFTDSIAFMFIGMIAFLFTEKYIYSKIDSKRYSKNFSIFLFVSGLLLIFKF